MAKPRRPCREDYTIGWVCALSIELAAAQEMLDEEHGDLDYDPNDTNIYTLGRIGEHNVVIACLPEGQTGTNSAAAVAVQMQSAFTSIRFGLMVGTGGGVPSMEADIRLGDVVVSRPNKVHGGVVQYDFGKATPSGFKRTGFLNTPPTILLSAVTKLRANRVRGKSRVTEYASKLDSLPTFTREDAGPDVLFEADYNHVEGAACEQCSIERAVERQSRDNQEIVVHYGTIASGNRVMRDAAERDRVSSELGGVLCFEMEAAGLMNCFPCLVIRGICDYADSHKTLEDTLNRLPYAEDAPFNSYSKQQESDCLPRTRVDLLYDIYNWVDGQDERCIFWLNGLAGTGKSTIARTVARKYSEERLGASFFFARGGGDVSRAGMFVTSIAVQLANNVPPLKRYICDAITDRSDIASQSLRDQWHHLVLRPLSKQDGNGCHSSYVLIVDALDECDDDNNIRIILQLLAEARTLKTVRLRVFLTSRPEISIRSGFCQIPDGEHQDFVLHHISPPIVDHDIYTFLEYNLRLIRQERRLGAGWPGKEVVTRLVQNASGLFIWAATACRFIREGKRFAVKRLDIILCGSSNAARGPEKRLDEIYITVLQNSIPSDCTDEEIEEQCRTLRHTLGSVVVLFSPLSARSLSTLLHVPKQDVDQTLEDLHAILDIPEDQTRPLRLHHPSFRDFLLNRERCRDLNFWVDEKQAHQMLAGCCIQLMSASLTQDICGVNAPGVRVADVESNRVEHCLPPGVQYACLYWIQHLQKSGTQLCDNDQVHQFLKFHLLHWLEALSWMRKISEGIHAIISLESIAIALEGQSGTVNKVTFSPDGKMVVSCDTGLPGRHGTVKVWDAATGALQQTLEGYWGPVNAVAFSPDSKMIISCDSGLQDDHGTVKLWDTATGTLQQTFEGHRGPVNIAAFSPDGKIVMSYDNGLRGDYGIVKLWDAATGALQQTFGGHQDPVEIVTFSPDGKMVAFCYNDLLGNHGTVKLWDTVTGALQQTLKGYHRPVTEITFSPDSKMVASCHSDFVGNGIKLWDAATGALQHKFESHRGRFKAVIFSPDGKMVASCDNGTFDKDGKGIVKLWNAATGALQQTLRHQVCVEAVTFSPDGKMVASCDNFTVKIWDAATGALQQTFKCYQDWVKAVTFSPDGRMVASYGGFNGFRDGTVKLWDTATKALQETLEGHQGWVEAITFSPDGKMVPSCSNGIFEKDGNGIFKLWDAATGALQQTFKGYWGSAKAITFSPDGKMVPSYDYGGWESDNGIIKLWNTTTATIQQTFKGHKGPVKAVTFSPDGKRVASCDNGDFDNYRNGRIMLWDAATGALQQTLKDYWGPVDAVAFSPDGKMIASCSGINSDSDRTVKLWDAVTGALKQTLEGHQDWVKAVAFSPNGKMVASYDKRTVKIWDAATGALQQTLKADAIIQTFFLSDTTFLQATRGLSHASLSFGNNLSQSSSSHGISMTEQWVRRGTEDMLWVPFEHRPRCTAVCGNAIAFGYESGRVSILEFAF
ncbi:hypothetical protein DL770_010563 [Monosporascus sp. CRB-9-2]|nr:hypothetical protein DL770_010563 [Monosporascus sp. CRB-9-2]